ncbi:MAG: DUF4286 family protein [Chitinophagaceae bacterium]|nr:DUF4286 family protein [Chitinophagaceae bacterium]
MIIYNVTTQVDLVIVEEWLKWMRDEHIPEVTGTGCFTHAVILQMIEIDISEAHTYAVQYHAESKSHYNRYIREYAELLRRKSVERWGNKVIAFRSVLQVVD